MAAPAAPLLQVHALHKHFGGVRANDGVDLAIPDGAIVGLIGPNGSGKTTLFNAITGHALPEGGRVVFDGQDITALGPAPTARLGLMRTFQQAGVYAGMSCLQCVLVSRRRSAEPWLAMWRRSDRDAHSRAHDLLAHVGLAGMRDRPARELSYGQRKLLELAMALMSRPRLLLLDEPTAGVSPLMIPALVERLHHANAVSGITFVVIEHNMQVIMDLAQQVYCMARGRVLASGTPAQVRSDRRVVQAYLGGV